jgi:LysM repeat protein
MKSQRSVLVVLSFVLLLGLVVGPPAAAAQPLQAPGGSGCAQFYQVKWGDTLYRIAVNHTTTTTALMALNGISNPNRIYAGQWLCVKAAPPGPTGFYYVVKWGDTLYRIGQYYGWTAAYLASINGLTNPHWIIAGQRLFIPYQ